MIKLLIGLHKLTKNIEIKLKIFQIDLSTHSKNGCVMPEIGVNAYGDKPSV